MIEGVTAANVLADALDARGQGGRGDGGEIWVDNRPDGREERKALAW